MNSGWKIPQSFRDTSRLVVALPAAPASPQDHAVYLQRGSTTAVRAIGFVERGLPPANFKEPLGLERKKNLYVRALEGKTPQPAFGHLLRGVVAEVCRL
jgi:hypothetical protein